MAENKIIELDVAILGGGFAGVYCARTASRLFRQNSGVKIGIISEENYMVFQPMLPEVAGSAISPRHVVNPLRLLCKRALVFRGRVEAIRWAQRDLVLNAGPFSGNFRVRYKHLVLALGATVDLSRIPGMPEHAFLMRNVGDAMFLRAAIVGRIEEANLEPVPEVKRRLLTFVVVGGGYSGVETAGQILDLFRTIHVHYPGISMGDLKVYLVHSKDHLLPTLSRRLGEYSARVLQRRGLQLLLNRRVKAVTAQRVYLQDGSSLETNTVICTVGNAPHPLVSTLCAENNLPSQRGQILTEPTGQVPGQSQLWAAGDCAAFPFVNGGFCPTTAQFAMRQGILIAKNLARSARNQSLKQFDFKGYGEMATIGHRVAVAEIFGFNFSGFLAWWLWRTVYLSKLPRLDRKIRVMLDWTLDLFFPRDINHLSPRYSELLKEIYLEKGDVLFQAGEPAFSLYIVKSGQLEVRDQTDGLTWRIGAGDYIGEQPLLGDGVWHQDASAMEPTKLVSVPAGIFRQTVQSEGSLAHFFQKSAAKYKAREVLQTLGGKVPDALANNRISAVMQRHLVTLRPDMSLRAALDTARLHPRSSYPLQDKENRLVGVITRDDLYEFIKRPDTTFETPLQRLPFSTLPVMQQDAPVDQVIRHFVRTGSDKVLLTDGDGRLCGIVTLIDILTAQGHENDDPKGSAEQKGNQGLTGSNSG